MTESVGAVVCVGCGVGRCETGRELCEWMPTPSVEWVCRVVGRIFFSLKVRQPVVKEIILLFRKL